MPEPKNEPSKLKGTLMERYLAETNDKQLPKITFTAPQSFSGTFKLNFKGDDNFSAGHSEIEVADDHIVILDFARAPHRQKGGFGRACFKSTIEYIESSAPGKKVVMSVAGFNEKAIELYKEFGFRFENEEEAKKDTSNYHTMYKK